MNISDSPSLPDDLRNIIAPLVGNNIPLPGQEGRVFTLGDDGLDGIPAVALPQAALHEVMAASSNDSASAAAFTMLMARRGAISGRPLLYIDERHRAARQGRLYAPGMMEIGLCPDRIIHACTGTSGSALQVAADAARSKAAGAVILSLSGRHPAGLTLSTTQRLSLFARESGLPVFLLRIDNAAIPSAAWSRWHVASAPSRPLEANAPGGPLFKVELLRHRGGKEGLSALLEWNREDRKFAAHTGAVPAIPVSRKNAGKRAYRAQRQCA